VEEVRELGGRRYNKFYFLHIDNITANHIRERTSGAVVKQTAQVNKINQTNHF
jgi:hypothetical protein